MGEKLYYLSVGGNQRGPFTIGQVRSLWQAGEVTADSFFWTENETEWKPLVSLVALLDPQQPRVPIVPPSVPSAPPYAPRFNAPSQLELIRIQSRLKSKGVAALLSVFVPFLGAFYSAPVAATMNTLIAAFFFQLHVVEQDSPGTFLVCSSIPYLIAILCAVRGVSRYNEQLLSEVEGSPDEEPTAKSTRETGGQRSKQKQQNVEACPRLYRPIDCTCFGFLFTPVFGSVLLALNWKQLKKREEAWIALLGGIIAFLLVVLLPESIPAANRAGCVFFAWWFIVARRYSRFVKHVLGATYEPKSFLLPLLVGLLVLVPLVLVAIEERKTVVPGDKVPAVNPARLEADGPSEKRRELESGAAELPQPSTPAPLAAGDALFVIRDFSFTTDSGVVGVRKGSRVTSLEDKGGTARIRVKGFETEVSKNYLSRSPAKSPANKDASDAGKASTVSGPDSKPNQTPEGDSASSTVSPAQAQIGTTDRFNADSDGYSWKAASSGYKNEFSEAMAGAYQKRKPGITGQFIREALDEFYNTDDPRLLRNGIFQMVQLTAAAYGSQ